MRRTVVLGLPALAVASLALSACTATTEQPAESRTVTVTKVVKDAPDATKIVPVANRQPAALSLESYSAEHFDIRVPRSWTLVTSDEDQGGFVRSVWRDPAEGDSSLTVDVVPGETTSPADKASEVRAATSRTAGYVEHTFAPKNLGGREAFRWAFDVSGNTRVDYLLNECGAGFAVLGSTSPSHFPALRSIYAAIARSLEPRCAAEPAEESAGTPAMPSGDRDCFEFVLQPSAQAYFESMGGSPANNVDRLDADHDGIACEWLPGGG
jgi:hypothetical protein